MTNIGKKCIQIHKYNNCSINIEAVFLTFRFAKQFIIEIKYNLYPTTCQDLISLWQQL